MVFTVRQRTDSKPALSGMQDNANSWFGPLDSTTGVWGVAPDRGSFSRLWRAFMSARVTIASVLVVMQAFVYALGSVSDRWSIAISLAYLLATVGTRLWARPAPPSSSFDAQWVSTIGLDVLVFSALNFLQLSGINYTPLFTLPVLLASVLGPISLALGTAAAVALLLLADAWWMSFVFSSGDLAARLLQAGLSGSGFFVVALLANQLALRLAREELLTKSSQSVARTQRRVNEVVVETLNDGVLVIDSSGIVRSANPASRRLLSYGAPMPATPFALAAQSGWSPLEEIMDMTFKLNAPQESELSLRFPARDARRLRVRTRLADSQDNARESLCVMFLQDLREMEARVRTEKMAAMGRMSAAVAHEIRNPLAAISQANALLEEDLHDRGHRQLTGMVRQNAERLAKIVDDILNIARVQVAGPDELASDLMLDEAVCRIAQEWSRQCAGGDSLVIAPGASRAAVPFDREHLRRVMVNLLDNAFRYASRKLASIEVATQMSDGQARITVWSDGLPLEQSVQAHLFEPFFSSESRSSGLGLYICRELCERYGAVIGYQRSLRGTVEGNEFYLTLPRVSFARPNRLSDADPFIA